MLEKQLKRLTRPLWAPLLGRLDTIAERVDRLDRAVAGLSSTDQLQAAIQGLRDDVWHSKVVNVGDRLLVGSRHLNMVFLVDVSDRLIGPRFIVDGEYEPETTAFMMRTIRPDFVCIDVGANFGYYTCLMAKLSWLGRTMSFEPDPQVFALLRDNVHINWCERVVEPTSAAVGAKDGTLTLHRRLTRSGNTSIVRMTAQELENIGEPESEEFSVDCVTLDDVGRRLERVDIVKIDVEGAESLVVDGMADLVRTHQPTVVMEWSPDQTTQAGFSVSALADRFKSLELQPHRLNPDGSIFRVEHAELARLSYQNLVFTPMS
jgi:FkbM family methyltransferase